ncbi:hypothetical protein EMPG_15402 [Blastomyces silverae]|uniref:WDR36/Utp21 C-terminal domain-containing protein n=1 Tax=Blastomyces silverae TaxID=2060906 RepID=A0A0H1BDG8_9EURO|nr:hypothetical protein EMPG_15402 [Blastomyces silverae]
MSVTGEFLATAHADGVGVSIWNNRSLFTHVPTKHIEEDAIVEVSAPTASGEGGAAILEAAFEEDAGDGGDEGPLVLSTEQLSSDMMTLSITPKSRWQTLLHLDVIKERNKPKEPPKVPQKAPFFLPSTLSKPDSDSTSLIPPAAATAAGAEEDTSETKKTTPAERSRIAKLQRANDPSMQASKFTTLLHSCSSPSSNKSTPNQTGNPYDPFIAYLKSLPPAKADLEIRSLDPGLLSGSRHGATNELVAFVQALTAQLRTRRDFELVNAWMAVFLRVHGDVVDVDGGEDGNGEGSDGAGEGGGEGEREAEGTRAALREALGEWKVEQEREGRRLAELVGYCRGIVGFLRSAR